MAWPHSLFLLNLQGQASGRQLLIAHRPHSSSLPTASHIQTYRQSPLPFLQIGRLYRGAGGCLLAFFTLFASWSLTPHGALGPRVSPHIGSVAPFPPCSSTVGALLPSPVTDKKTLSRREINLESRYQKPLKELLPFSNGEDVHLPEKVLQMLFVLCPLANPRSVQLPQHPFPPYQRMGLI